MEERYKTKLVIDGGMMLITGILLYKNIIAPESASAFLIGWGIGNMVYQFVNSLS